MSGFLKQFRKERVLKDLLKERFIVSLVDGNAIDGLFIDADSKTMRLADCYRVTSDGTRMLLDGEMFIPRGNVTYIQKP